MECRSQNAEMGRPMGRMPGSVGSDAIAPRDFGTAQRVGTTHKIVLFGGYDGKKWLADAHVLDTAAYAACCTALSSISRRLSSCFFLRCCIINIHLIVELNKTFSLFRK